MDKPDPPVSESDKAQEFATALGSSVMTWNLAEKSVRDLLAALARGSMHPLTAGGRYPNSGDGFAGNFRGFGRVCA